MARFINAPDAREVVFLRGASEALSLLGDAFADGLLEKRDEVLVTQMEHHCTTPTSCRGRSPAGTPGPCSGRPRHPGRVVDMAAFEKHLTKRTKVVAATHVSNVLGTVNPVKGICEMARDRGATAVVDAAQSAPHLPVDVRDIKCDFLAASGHKMGARTGVGFLYGWYEWLERLQPQEGGSDAAKRVTLDGLPEFKPPHRHEDGIGHPPSSSNPRTAARLVARRKAGKISALRAAARRPASATHDDRGTMSNPSRAKREYIPTGVPGLDHVLRGGFLREGFYLLQADPGSGKTTVALQFVLGRVKAGEPCLYVTLTESRADLEDACASHGWSTDGLEICDLTEHAATLVGESRASVFHPSETELGDTTKAILAAVERVKPRHVVFDGLAELRLLSGDSLRYRRQLLALKQFFKERGVTVLLLDDRSNPFGDVQPESLVGGNVVMERFLPEYGKARRRLYVTKVRGSNFREGYNDYEIVEGGVVVHPRLVAAEHHDRFERSAYPSGVKSLDDMLDGGLTTGTTTLLLGPAGAGKSTTAMQFVANALKRGDRAAVYTFDEVLGTLFDRSEKLCLGSTGGMRRYQADGLLHAQQIDAAELTAGAFASEVRRVVEAGAKVIVIDSLNGYLNAMPEERFLVTHLHELFAYLNQKGVVTIMVVAQHGLISTGPSEIDVSYLADTVLLFRYFEAAGEIRQALSVFKKRTGHHQRTLRQLRITADGLAVGEPLAGFRGVMTGTPEYEGETRMLDAAAGGGAGGGN